MLEKLFLRLCILIFSAIVFFLERSRAKKEGVKEGMSKAEKKENEARLATIQKVKFIREKLKSADRDAVIAELRKPPDRQ